LHVTFKQAVSEGGDVLSLLREVDVAGPCGQSTQGEQYNTPRRHLSFVLLCFTPTVVQGTSTCTEEIY